MFSARKRLVGGDERRYPSHIFGHTITVENAMLLALYSSSAARPQRSPMVQQSDDDVLLPFLSVP